MKEGNGAIKLSPDEDTKPPAQRVEKDIPSCLHTSAFKGISFHEASMPFTVQNREIIIPTVCVGAILRGRLHLSPFILDVLENDTTSEMISEAFICKESESLNYSCGCSGFIYTRFEFWGQICSLYANTICFICLCILTKIANIATVNWILALLVEKKTKVCFKSKCCMVNSICFMLMIRIITSVSLYTFTIMK